METKHNETNKQMKNQTKTKPNKNDCCTFELSCAKCTIPLHYLWVMNKCVYSNGIRDKCEFTHWVWSPRICEWGRPSQFCIVIFKFAMTGFIEAKCPHCFEYECNFCTNWSKTWYQYIWFYILHTFVMSNSEKKYINFVENSRSWKLDYGPGPFQLESVAIWIFPRIFSLFSWLKIWTECKYLQLRSMWQSHIRLPWNRHCCGL